MPSYRRLKLNSRLPRSAWARSHSPAPPFRPPTADAKSRRKLGRPPFPRFAKSHRNCGNAYCQRRPARRYTRMCNVVRPSQTHSPRRTSHDEQALHRGGRGRRPPGAGRGRGRGDVAAGDHLRARLSRRSARAVSRAPGSTHCGDAQVFGVRQKKGVAEMEWKSAPLPAEIRGDSVTFVWTGAMGFGPGGGSFTIFVNGHAAADFDAVLESTQFPAAGQELPPALRRPLHLQRAVVLRALLLDRAQGVGRGGPAGGPSGQGHGRGRGDLVLRWCAPTMRRWRFPITTGPCSSMPRQRRPERRPPPGEEASYEWYRRQYFGPRSFSRPSARPPTRPRRPSRPAGSSRAPSASTRITGTYYAINGTAFGLWENGQAMPMGIEGALRQSLEDGYLPIVAHPVASRRPRHPPAGHGRAVAGRLVPDGTGKHAGLGESSTSPTTANSLARSPFSPPNRATTAIPSETSPTATAWRWKMAVPWRPRGAARLQPGVPGRAAGDEEAGRQGGPQRPENVARRGRAVQCAAARGRIEPGQTVQVAVNRVFDAPPAYYWSGVPPKVAAEELTARTPEHAFAIARTTWKTLVRGRVAADDARRRAEPHRGQGDAGRILPHEALEWPLDRLRFRLLSLPMGQLQHELVLCPGPDGRPCHGGPAAGHGLLRGRGSGSRRECAPTRDVSPT